MLLHAPELAYLREALLPDIRFVEYGHGTQTPAQFQEGRIDVGLTGATPPLTIQAQGGELVYLAVGQPRPNSGAVVVPADSSIKTLADLKGKRIGLAVGSWHSSFLALALDTVGLGYDGVIPVSYVQTQGRVDTASVDAWVARPEEIDDASLRVLLRSGEVWSNRGVVFARRSVLAGSGPQLARLIAALDAAGRWIGEHPARAAELLAPISPVGAAALRRSFEVQPQAEGLSRPDERFLREQQRAADLLARAGVFAPIRLDAERLLPIASDIWQRVEALAAASVQ
ncbi:MAG: ABC transporter substrate-binding protein [Xenophilus sp.]